MMEKRNMVHKFPRNASNIYPREADLVSVFLQFTRSLRYEKITYEIFFAFKDCVNKIRSIKGRLEKRLNLSLLKPVGRDSAFPGPLLDLYSPPRYPVLVFKRAIAQRMKNMVASCMKVGAKAITEFMTESGRIEHEACRGMLNKLGTDDRSVKTRSRSHLDPS